MMKNRGVTLIALVVTIIVLLILAVVSFRVISGDDGILNKAETAASETERAKAEEQFKLLQYEWKIENAENGKTLIDFLKGKVQEGKIESVEQTDDGIEVCINGFMVVAAENGTIRQEMQKAVAGPKIVEGSLKVSLANGTEITKETTPKQEIGTVLKLTFEASLEGGTITGVNLPEGATVDTATGEVSYTTNGNELNLIFELVGEINGTETKAKRKVSLVDYYEKVLTAESLLKAVEDNTFADEEICKVQVEDETYSLHIYNYNTDLTISENTEFGDATTDAATSTSSMAKNMVVLKVDGDLTINEGVTLTACKNASGYGGPKGMLIYCSGTLTNNGTISMTARGAYAEGQDVYLWKNADNSYEVVPADGASANTNGKNRKTGGGANGNGNYGHDTPGYGTAGTSYSGGSGGGGSYDRTGTERNGKVNGGSGGRGYAGNSSSWEIRWRRSW